MKQFLFGILFAGLVACSSEFTPEPAAVAIEDSIAPNAVRDTSVVRDSLISEAEDKLEAVKCKVSEGSILTPGRKDGRTISCQIADPYVGYARYGETQRIVKVDYDHRAFRDVSFKANLSGGFATDFVKDANLTYPDEVTATISVGERKRLANRVEVVRSRQLPLVPDVAPQLETLPALPAFTVSVGL